MIGRYLLAGLLCYAGSLSLFDGRAYYEGVIIDGIMARVIGAISIIAGAWLIFKKPSKGGASKRDDPPDFS